MTTEQAQMNERELPSTAQSLPIAIFRAREKVMAPVRAMLAGSGISEQEWRAMRVLAEYGPLDASTLAYRAGLQLSSQTRVVQSLVEKGLAKRTTDTNDRRRQLAEVTGDGRRILAQNVDPALDVFERIETVLGRERLNQLLTLLRELERL